MGQRQRWEKPNDFFPARTKIDYPLKLPAILARPQVVKSLTPEPKLAAANDDGHYCFVAAL